METQMSFTVKNTTQDFYNLESCIKKVAKNNALENIEKVSIILEKNAGIIKFSALGDPGDNEDLTNAFVEQVANNFSTTPPQNSEDVEKIITDTQQNLSQPVDPNKFLEMANTADIQDPQAQAALDQVKNILFTDQQPNQMDMEQPSPNGQEPQTGGPPAGMVGVPSI